jgi:imidazolonepropionase-like amidohydrolase
MMMLNRIPKLVLLITSLAVIFISPARHCIAKGAPLVLYDALLIDGTGSDPIADAVVIIDKDKIQYVGSTKSIEMPSNAIIINLDGKVIIPGFINAHVHSKYNDKNLKGWAQGGVTTVRDLALSNLSFDWFNTRNMLLKDPMNARLMAVGPMVTAPDGYPIQPFKLEAVTVSGVSNARAEIRKLIHRGADLIKLAMEDGKYYKLPKPLPVPSSEDVAAVVATAHQLGKKVSVHVTNPDLLPALISAGVDDLAHMVLGNLSEDLAKLAIKKGIYWVPTLELWHHIQAHPKAVAAKFKPYDMAIKNLRLFVSLGGKVALGTDFGGIPGGAPFELGMPMLEIISMKNAGMTPMQIIVAATKHAAHVCGMDQQLGAIKEKMIADIVVLNNNPLDDLDNLKDVAMVIHNGVIIKNQGKL